MTVLAWISGLQLGTPEKKKKKISTSGHLQQAQFAVDCNRELFSVVLVTRTATTAVGAYDI